MNYGDHVTFEGFQHPDTDRSILRHKMGRLRVDLFKEYNRGVMDPIYTMKDESVDGLPSAYLIYMSCESEFEAAMKLVGSWSHWQKLLNCPVLMDGNPKDQSWTGFKSWREQKEMQDAAKAYQQLKLAAELGNVAAAKAIWEGKSKSQKGRPAKAQVKAAAKEQAAKEAAVVEDFERIKLAVDNVKGS